MNLESHAFFSNVDLCMPEEIHCSLLNLSSYLGTVFNGTFFERMKEMGFIEKNFQKRDLCLHFLSDSIIPAF